jgi:arginine exporter protein ArgO
MKWSWPEARATIGIIIIMCMIVLVALIFLFPAAVDGHPAVLNTLTMLAGAMIANGTAVVQYYFGSSVESKNKGDVLAQIAGSAANTNKTEPQKAA